MTSAPALYMEKTRRYYQAQGFEKAYQWAQFDEIPFSPLSKALEECTIALITTAVPDGAVPKLLRKASSLNLDQVPDQFFTDDLSWDKEATHTDDRQSYFPLEACQSLVEEGTLGQLAPRFHFVPTDYSQRHTIEDDAPSIVAACLEDEVDIAILIPL